MNENKCGWDGLSSVIPVSLDERATVTLSNFFSCMMG
jgi:hypothetical protein